MLKKFPDKSFPCLKYTRITRRQTFISAAFQLNSHTDICLLEQSVGNYSRKYFFILQSLIKIFQPNFGGDDQHAVKLLFPGLESVDISLKKNLTIIVPIVFKFSVTFFPKLHHEVSSEFLAKSISIPSLDEDSSDDMVLEQVDLQIVQSGEM